MKWLAQKVRRFLAREDGPTAVEYAVMLALIIIVCLTGIQAVGTRASSTFQNSATKLPSGAESGPVGGGPVGGGPGGGGPGGGGGMGGGRVEDGRVEDGSGAGGPGGRGRETSRISDGL